MTLMAENRPTPAPVGSWVSSAGGVLGCTTKGLPSGTPDTEGHVQDSLTAFQPSATGTQGPLASHGPAAAPSAQLMGGGHAGHQAPCERSPLSELATTNAQGTSAPDVSPQSSSHKEEALPGPNPRRSHCEPGVDKSAEGVDGGAGWTDRGAGSTDKGRRGCTDRLAEFKEKYEVGRVLGRGAFGDVIECTERATPRRVWACKVVDTHCLGSEEEREALAREIHIMGLLKGQHQGVVQLRETLPPYRNAGDTPSSCPSTSTSSSSSARSFTGQGPLYPGSFRAGMGKGKGEGLVRIVMEKCGGGDLHNAIATRGRMPETSAKHVFCQVASTLAFCHSRGVIHRDIKPENILFDTSPDCLFAHASTLPRLSASGELPRVQAKLADFGLAVLVRPGETTTGLLGSRFYTAPEVLLGLRYGRRVDVWGLGVCLYVMLSGRLPFVGRTRDDEEGLKSAILKGRAAFDRPGWEGVSEAAKDLVRRMLHPQPHKRIQSRELLAHHWCAGHHSSGGTLPSPLTVPFILTIPSPISRSGPLPSPLTTPPPLSMPSPALMPASVTIRGTGSHTTAASPGISTASSSSGAASESEHVHVDPPALAESESIALSAQPSSGSSQTESESEAEQGFGWGFGGPTVAPKAGERKGGKRLHKQCSAGDELSAKTHPLWAMFYSLRLGASESYSTYCQMDCRRA